MSDSVAFIDDLLNTFQKEISPSNTNNNNNNNNNTIENKSKSNANTKHIVNTTCHKTTKHQNGKIESFNTTSCDKAEVTPPRQSDEEKEEEFEDKNDDQKEDELNEKELDELSEEEALRIAMEMSMNEDDRKLIYSIKKEIKEAQGHLSNWFCGNFKCVRDKNRAWCDFCKRLHHQFEMYRIEQGVIQPLAYQFFIQFIALMYGTMKNVKKGNDLSIDQHKIRNILILSADDDAIKYLRFKQGISKTELTQAIYAKFESLALDPMNPNQWKFNHVMFIKSDKAPNGLLWAKWHMQ